MKQESIIGQDEAAKQVRKHMSPRAIHLANLENWVTGNQYDGLKNWFEDAPIHKKAPCIVDPIISDSIESHVDMVLGEGRFPIISTRPQNETASDDGEDENSPADTAEDESECLDKLIVAACEQAKFKAVCREALQMAMTSSSVCALLGTRSGRLVIDTVKARWCEPELDLDGNVTKLVIQYPYTENYQNSLGEWCARAMVYRREIDDKTDVTMKPALATTRIPEWTPAVTINHNFGFSPAIWYPLFRGCSIVGSIDGHAPHENLLDEVHAHNVALSQRHRASLYVGDPQWTECGVDLKSNPGQKGKSVPAYVTTKGGKPSSDNPIISSMSNPPIEKEGRKKHPGSVWQYEDKDTKVTLHSLPADALDAITANARDIEMKIMRALAYVPLDPESANVVRGALSGKALETLRERQINRDDRIRDDFADGFIRPVISMLLRIIHSQSAGLKLPGAKEAAPMLERLCCE